MVITGIIILVYIIFMIPREFNKEYNGVKYRLGKSEEGIIEKVIIKFEGKTFRNWKLEEKFRGIIYRRL